MVDYEVTVFTANVDDAGTFNSIYITLVGTEGKSERKLLSRFKGLVSFIRGAVSSFTVSCPVSIGKLILIELDKQSFISEDGWFPAKVEVKSPEGKTYTIPIYRWIIDNKVHHFREGTALRVFQDNYDAGKKSREEEMKERAQDYCWMVYAQGLPECFKAKKLSGLPSAARFSVKKDMELFYTVITGVTQMGLEGLKDSTEDWTDIVDIDRVFPKRWTFTSDYVEQYWKEDNFFGYQYLNGINPMMIRRCSALPDNFPVTDAMVFPGGRCNLAEEMKKGNIFLCDYKCLDGLKPNTLNKKDQYLMAPLVLLHSTPDDELMPIAIQLKQKAAKDNPIFLPTDSEYDWLLAKIFVRSADFNLHELSVHLLHTHLLAEVFTVSLMRNFPMVHPLYKLLVPHTHDTLEINYLARHLLISEDGFFKRFSASGAATVALMKRAWSSVTYDSLCIPEDIAARGLEDVPNFYYRDDGLRIWDIIHRFVQGILNFYYKTDKEVQKDSELQNWISDIFVHGFLSRADTGIPQSFTTVAELVKFVTMVIFTCSAQHSAVNNGQYDYDGWMPNAPSTMQLPPPTKKGKTNMATMLKTLPNKGTTANAMAILWLLSQQFSDFVALGQYPEEHFSEDIPREMIKVLQGDLQALSADIKIRNKSLDVPYTFLDPSLIDNSVGI